MRRHGHARPGLSRKAPAVVIVCLIAAAAASSSTGATRPKAGPPPQPVTTAANRQAAIRDAAKLLSGVVAPPAATVQSSSTSVGPHGRLTLITTAFDSAVDRRTWTVPENYAKVLPFVLAHLPPGSEPYEKGGGGPPPSLSVIRAWPPIASQLGARLLSLQVTETGPNQTLLSAVAQSQWLVVRPASEQVPAGVRRLTVTSGVPGTRPLVSRTVTNRREIQTLVALFDSLPIVQPSAISCPGLFANTPVVTVTFKHSATGPALARARVLATAPHNLPATDAVWACFPVDFSVMGHRRAALAGDVLGPIQRLLHVRLDPHPQR